MRLVAVSIVKDEADIIEPFVRHTLGWVDQHLIFDHDSTDGTREILCALQAEGLPITLFTDGALGNLQQSRSNRLTTLAAQAQEADWILPLDADEFIAGPSRSALEKYLAGLTTDQAASLPLLNYFPTTDDDPTIGNPVLRLRHCQKTQSLTRKIMVPRQLALEDGLQAGKGSHALYRGSEKLPDHALPAEYHLAHLALRSPQHQLLRVVLAELQKLSRGSAHAGLDLHYRLGFQLLAENPDVFFATVRRPAATARLLPITYLGGELRHTPPSAGWNRVARALLGYLEQLALSHGRLVDAAGPSWLKTNEGEEVLCPLTSADSRCFSAAGLPEAFEGFAPGEGWCPPEGPVPDAFLPAFHWGLAPVTTVLINSATARAARMVAEVLTYTEGQSVEVTLNDIRVLEQTFARVNQKEFLVAPLVLHPGENRLSFRCPRHLTTDYDSRKLALIFLSLRVLDPADS